MTCLSGPSSCCRVAVRLLEQMLTLHRLHTKDCVEDGGAKSRYDYASTKCKCPIHVNGVCGGQYIREGH